LDVVVCVKHVPETAEACGITVQGNNKWRTLIQNAKLSTESLQGEESI
jgi:hypothetical protein